MISGQLKLRGFHHVNGYPKGRDLLILFTEEESHATALTLNKGVYISLAQPFRISGCLVQVLENFSLCQNRY